MATCRFPGCAEVNGSSALPPGWVLVQVDRRLPDRAVPADAAGPASATSPATSLSMDRRRWLLCPAHGALMDVLGAPVPDAVSDTTATAAREPA